MQEVWNSHAGGVELSCSRCVTFMQEVWNSHAGGVEHLLIIQRTLIEPPSDRAERLLSTATSGNLFGTAAVRAMAAFVFDPFIGYSGTFAIDCYRPLTVVSTRCGSSNGRFAFDREWQRCSRHQRNHFTIMPHIGSVDTSDLRVPASGPGSIALAPNA